MANKLDEARKQFRYTDGDRPLFFFYAIRYLCAQPKERSTDCLKNLVIKKFEQGYVPEVPDYAYDVHTAKGRAKGRDVMHFLDVSSRVLSDENVVHIPTKDWMTTVSQFPLQCKFHQFFCWWRHGCKALSHRHNCKAHAF